MASNNGGLEKYSNILFHTGERLRVLERAVELGVQRARQKHSNRLPSREFVTRKSRYSGKVEPGCLRRRGGSYCIGYNVNSLLGGSKDH